MALVAGAQEKIYPKDFGYNNKVKQVDEIYYQYSIADKRYNITKEQTLYFSNGKLTRRNLLSTILGVVEYDIYYTYNQQGRLSVVIEKVNGVEKGKYNYVYKNGSLVAISGVYNNSKEESSFEYNTKGQLQKKIAKADGELSAITLYSDYKSVDSYTETVTNYLKGKITGSEITRYLKGLIIAEGSCYGVSDPMVLTELEYDSKGNVIKRTSPKAIFANAYEYDDEGNAIRAMFGGNQMGGQPKNVFRFSKITYISGMALGVTDLNYFFVSSREKNVESYKAQSRLSRPKTGTPQSGSVENWASFADSSLEIYLLKNADGTYKVLDDKGNDMTKDVAKIKAPNNLDLMIYDSVLGYTLFFKGFFSATTTVGEKLKGQYLDDSANGAYFVRTNQGKNVYMIYEGKYLSLSQYQVAKSVNGLDVNISKEGKKLFVLKNYYDVNLVKEDVFYPVVSP